MEAIFGSNFWKQNGSKISFRAKKLFFKKRKSLEYSALLLNVTRLNVTIFDKFSKIDC